MNNINLEKWGDDFDERWFYLWELYEGEYPVSIDKSAVKAFISELLKEKDRMFVEDLEKANDQARGSSDFEVLVSLGREIDKLIAKYSPQEGSK